MKIYLNLDSPTRAFAAKEDHVNELTSVFPSLEAIRVHSTRALSDALGDAEFVATWRFRPEFYEMAPKLRAVFTPAAGREWVAADPSGKVPTYYGTFHGMLMAESLLAMVLHFNRNLPLLAANKLARSWDRDAFSHCRSLSVQRALVIGYGNVGRACARGLASIGCNVVGVRRTPQAGDLDPAVRTVVRFDEMEPHLARADHVILVLPGGEDTTNIFTREHFAAMKATAHLYNLGRGNCYREEDLVWALESGTIAGAGLDVFAEEPLPESSRLWELSNTLIMPHASAVYDDYMDLFLAEMIGHLHQMLRE